MKKVIKLTESDLARIVRRVIKEQTEDKVISQLQTDKIIRSAEGGKISGAPSLYQGYDVQPPYNFFAMQEIYKPENGQFKVNVYKPYYRIGGNTFQFGQLGVLTFFINNVGKWTTTYQGSGLDMARVVKFDGLFYGDYGIEMNKIVNYLNVYAQRVPSFAAVLKNIKENNIISRIKDPKVQELYTAMGLVPTTTPTTPNNTKG